jgi:hypothetical protein
LAICTLPFGKIESSLLVVKVVFSKLLIFKSPFSLVNPSTTNLSLNLPSPTKTDSPCIFKSWSTINFF